MVTVEANGRLTFSLVLTRATRIEVVGAFNGWHEDRMPMHRHEDGRWSLTVTPPSGEILFRYLVDGEQWLLDAAAHGTKAGEDGVEKSRVWVPPQWQEPDAIAA